MSEECAGAGGAGAAGESEADTGAQFRSTVREAVQSAFGAPEGGDPAPAREVSAETVTRDPDGLVLAVAD